MILDTTGKRIERLRKDRGMRQIDLAEAVEVRQNYISAIERDVASPSAEVIAQIALALDTTTDFLLLLTHDHRRPLIAPTSASLEPAYA